MIFDPLYLLVMGAGMVLSLGANWLVKSRFAKYSQLGTRSQMTGAEVARAILRDKRHPRRHRRARPRTALGPLRPAQQDAPALGAGVRGPQHGGLRRRGPRGRPRHPARAGYAPLRFRSAWVPVASTGGNISIFVIIAAFFMGGMETALGGTLAIAGVGLFATTTLFTLVTLPVEFDASRGPWWRSTAATSRRRSTTVRGRC